MQRQRGEGLAWGFSGCVHEMRKIGRDVAQMEAFKSVDTWTRTTEIER